MNLCAWKEFIAPSIQSEWCFSNFFTIGGWMDGWMDG